jgi:hypothetical protein
MVMAELLRHGFNCYGSMSALPVRVRLPAVAMQAWAQQLLALLAWV